MLQPGLYEQVINQQMREELSALPAACQASAVLDKAEASHNALYGQLLRAV